MFNAVLFTIAKIWKHLSVHCWMNGDKWIKKMWYIICIHTYTYIHVHIKYTQNGMLLSYIKEWNVLLFATTWIDLPKETKDLYSKKYKILMKNIKDNTEIYTMFLDWNNQYCENDHTTKAIYRFSVITIKSPMAIFHRIRKKI